MKLITASLMLLSLTNTQNLYAQGESVQEINTACATEASSFCKNQQGQEMKVGKGLLKCLMANKDKVSKGCKMAVRNGQKNRKKGQNAEAGNLQTSEMPEAQK